MSLAEQKLMEMLFAGSIDRGLLFELCVLEKVERDIANGELGFDPKMVQVFHRKKYKSADGKDLIEADVSIELTRHGANEPMLIIIWECKNTSVKVGRGKIQKFLGDIQELGASRVKGIVASPLGFTRWARAYAFKHGIGLWHVVMPKEWRTLREDWKWKPPVWEPPVQSRPGIRGSNSGDLEDAGQFLMVILGLIVGFFWLLAAVASRSCSGP